MAPRELGEAPLPVRLRRGNPVQPRHYWRVPRYVHGHHNRRGHWRVHQLCEAGYLTVPEVAKALGCHVPAQATDWVYTPGYPTLK
jgi:hypothetical protein